MNKLFPNIETAIIVVGLLCVMLWGVSRCRKQKDDLAVRAATEGTINPDTVISPAATKTPISQPIAIPPTNPSVVSTTPTPQYSPTAPANPGQAAPQPVTQQPNNIPSSYNNAPTTASSQGGTINNAVPTVTSKSPRATTAAPAVSTTVQPSGSSLYVLRGGLNVRTQPNVKSKSLGKLKLHDQVYFLNEVSDTPETVRLENGTEVTKPWFKIQTKRGTIGWVHGSGVDFYIRKPHQTY